MSCILLWNLIVALCRYVNILMANPNERMGHQKWILNLSLFYHDFLHITIIKYHNVQSLLQFILFLSIGRVYTDSTMRCHQNLNDS